jgi:CelD/BcsL family acetyltransferase involved in cellulose biosynthesis
MGNRWTIRPIRLRYRLGPFTLHRHRMNFAVLDAHFTTLGSSPEDMHPPFQEWNKQVVGAHVPGHPVSSGTTLPRVALLPEAIRYVPSQKVRYFIDLTGTFDQYLAKFSSKTRSTLKRKVRKLAERSGGTIDWRRYVTPEEMKEFHSQARLVAEKTYQERLLDAALPGTQEFQAELQRLAAEGRARGYILFLDGQPIAYLYCPIQEGAVIYEHLGYDPAHKELSAGTVLQYLVLEELFAEGRFKVFDFTEGDSQHKEQFSTGSVDCAHLYYFRRTVTNACLVAAHIMLGEMTKGTLAILERAGVRERVRRYLRSRA